MSKIFVDEARTHDEHERMDIQHTARTRNQLYLAALTDHSKDNNDRA
jgi:hypothetical protein